MHRPEFRADDNIRPKFLNIYTIKLFNTGSPIPIFKHSGEVNAPVFIFVF